jgi:hypothetical protein
MAEVDSRKGDDCTQSEDGDVVDFPEAGVHQMEKGPSPNSKSLVDVASTYAKYLLSSALTITYLIYIMWGIWTGEAVLPVPSVAHFLIFCFCMTLVAYLEGLQVAILAVEHDDCEVFRESHPRAHKLMKSVKQGNNVERFLVGRQFFTIFVMTLIAQVTTFPMISHLGINSVVWFILIQTGLPGAIVVTTIGSLQPQLLAAKDPWKFMNLYGTNAVLQLCYGLEETGICTHFAYMLIAICRKTVFRSDIVPREHNRGNTLQGKILDGCKYLLSLGVIGIYVSYIMYGIWTDQAVLPAPAIAVFLIYCCCGLFLAHLEGLQVAILLAEPKNLEEYKESHPRGYKLMKRATHEKNVRRFLIGRQFFVIFVVFLINQCTIFPDIEKFGVNPVVWFIFFQLGFPTALNVLCFFQLPAQLLGNHDPFMFMDRYGPGATLEICLFTEITGLAHFSWVVSAMSRATWFRIPKSQPADFSKLEMMEANGVKKTAGTDAETNRITDYATDKDGTNNNDDAAYSTEEGALEMHTDISHALKDEEDL